MTKLGKPVTRETSVIERGDPLIVELHPKYLVLRVKGKRTSAVSIPYDSAYDLGRKLAARSVTEQKLQNLIDLGKVKPGGAGASSAPRRGSARGAFDGARQIRRIIYVEFAQTFLDK
jgi:hypothetical protein